MKFNGAGVGSAVVFLVLVSMVRLGDKSLFSTAQAEEDFAKQIKTSVEEANKAGKKAFKRPDRR
jgi:hypothetical protein